MLNMNTKLIKREEDGQTIRAGIVGAGQMGRGLAAQLVYMRGMKPVIVSDHDAQKAAGAYKLAGVDESDIAVVSTLSEANRQMEQGKYVATDNTDLVTSANLVECVVDATGIHDVGAQVATDAINNHKHIVMLNVECDVVIGPYLKRLAEKNGVVYTGSAGDEPGAVMELYCFATAIGFDVLVIGKGKNNAIDYHCNPDTVRQEAEGKRMSPRMLCSFKDGSKTMVEMTAMSNATGLVPDIIGGHGISSDIEGLNKKYRLKADGGILNRHGVVEFVNGIAPGVFATVSTQNDEAAYVLKYLNMGDGPLWTLYRPYHLTNLETPLTIAKAVMDHESTIVPIDGLVSECITVAKRDLKAGERIDGIGGYTTYGSIASIGDADENGYVPYGLVNDKAVMKRDCKHGQLLTLDDIQLDNTSLIYRLRKKQDEIYGRDFLE